MRLSAGMILALAAYGTLPAGARDGLPEGAHRDRVQLRDGSSLAGELVELGGARLEIRIHGGSKSLLRRDIESVVLDAERPARGRATSDAVIRPDGKEITGIVEVLAGGQRVRVTKPGGSSVLLPAEELTIVRRGDPIARTTRVFTDRTAEEIAESLATLESLEDVDAATRASVVAREEAFLIECGIFAIEDVRRILAEDAVLRDGGGRGKLTSAAREALESVDRVYRLKCVVAPEIEDYEPNVYKILAYAERQEKVDLLFFVFYRFAEQAVPLAGFLAREEGEDEVVRAYAIDVLRRLRKNRELVEIYRSSTGKTQLASAIALGKNHVLFGVPALIDALEMSDPEVRDLAVTHLREFSGETFRFRPTGAPEARRLAVLRWRAWWSENREELEDRSRRILAREDVETPEQRQAVELWRQATAAGDDSRMAEAYLRRALEIDPLFFRARLALAALELTEFNRPAQALEQLVSIEAESRPDLTAGDRFWVFLYLGHAKRVSGDARGALEAYRHAASYDADNLEGAESLGEMAYVVATTEPGMDPEERKATLELSRQAYTAALSRIEACEQSLVTFSIDDLPIEEHLRFDRRRHNRTVLGFRKQYRADRLRCVLSLARTESLLGRKKEAIERLEGGLEELAPLRAADELRSTEVKMRNFLGILHEEAGDRAGALRQFKYVLENLDTENEESRRGIQRLRARRVGN